MLTRHSFFILPVVYFPWSEHGSAEKRKEEGATTNGSSVNGMKKQQNLTKA
jgi:hypothetical protein